MIIKILIWNQSTILTALFNLLSNSELAWSIWPAKKCYRHRKKKPKETLTIQISNYIYANWFWKRQIHQIYEDYFESWYTKNSSIFEMIVSKGQALWPEQKANDLCRAEYIASKNRCQYNIVQVYENGNGGSNYYHSMLRSI